jgi:hypothetical protein
MATFITTAVVTFIMFAVAVLIINYCKARATNGKHGLTGMCHRSGSASCCSGIQNIGTKSSGAALKEKKS